MDWALHRRTEIERTAGVRESAIHLAMMAEVGLPATALLLCEVDPALLAVLAGAALAHGATALGDVRTAEDAGRRVSVLEQHVHSFLEALPLTALSIIGCLHPDQVRELSRGRITARLTLRSPPLPRRFLLGVGLGAPPRAACTPRSCCGACGPVGGRGRRPARWS
ncbi:diguanylate cyclase [Kitasatospora cheerisanensis KCTC 2395]|uniref:Diguanylate cyclase n=1 Tax=Kitasatospora cheerisanensis KCTC 2395 TaxID=1348663 RepID=A0A066Z1D1_9ACTN|nr:diguanylate cyclase [Kitasatospora cheerisanensis KCTC 2395]